MSLVIGLALTLLAATGQWLGLWQPLERLAADARWRHFAADTPPPSNRIVHVDIDDLSIARTGRWPWPRSYLARVVDELRRAGAEVIAFDILIDEPQPPRAVRQNTPARPEAPDARSDDPNAGSLRLVHDDDRLVQSIEQAGNVVMAMVAARRSARGPVARQAIERLVDDPLLDADPLVTSMQLTGERAAYVRESLSLLKERAIRRRLLSLVDARGRLPAFDSCRAVILADLPDSVTGAVEQRILRREYDTVRSLAHLRRATLPSPRPDDPVTARTPLWPITRAAAGVGSVTYEADPDGHVRSVPLWISEGGRLYPHFALVIACRMLDVPIGTLRIVDHRTVIPDAAMADGTRQDIRIPMRRARHGDGWTLDRDRVTIPWPSDATSWQGLYTPNGNAPSRHVSIGRLVEAPRERADLADNELQADLHAAAILNEPMLQGFGIAPLKADYIAMIDARESGELSAVQIAERTGLRAKVLDKAEQVLGMFEGLDDLSDEEAALKQSLQTHARFLKMHKAEAQRGRKAIADYQRSLRDRVEGAACLVGWTATGSIADFVPTWLDGRTPGVAIHGAVLNGILTDHIVRRAPLGVDVGLVGLVGLLVSIVTARLAPVGALLVTVGLVAGYVLVNGMVLFDRMDLQAAAAGPAAAAGLAWISITVYRLVREQRERARITRQFKNYVSRDLVDLLVANPNLIKQGRHELTCMFSDIAGFTGVSERLGPEQTIELLNRYLRAMTHQIIDGRGTVNKYLGDGIMAFWGAPLDDDQHTLNACRSMLRCIEQMKRLADDERLVGLPRLFMRVGIATGPMMVGDCGAPPERSDYTVIGDTVNLASRLEASNTQFGTQVLLNRRTHERVADDVVARPIGRIVVVGRDEPEPVYELLAMNAQATDAQRRFAKASAEAVAAYADGDFERAGRCFEDLAGQFGRSELTDLYLDRCR
ncbi:MAG: CHASE2 domain-containing protein, partial [Alphaproteobacteria bacterium]|nr:CHASE2 domain-containing protein [Alphaproteobacteria bacterium]